MSPSPATNLAEVLRRVHGGARDAATIASLIAAAEPFARGDHLSSKRLLKDLDRLESHIDNSPIAVAEWTPDGRILRWSEGARRIFEWSREELEARKHLPGWGMLHPEDVARVGDLMQQLTAGRLSRFTAINRNFKKSGAMIWCQWFNSALLDKQGKVVSIFSHAVELSERFEAERQMREARDRLEFHVHNSPVAVTEWGPDYRWLRWSNGAERIFGYSESEMVGQSFVNRSFIHPDDIDQLQDQMELLLTGRLPRFSTVNRNIRKDGSVIHCEWHNSALLSAEGKVISVLSQAVDVTDRIVAEQNFRHTRDTLEKHLDNSAIAIVEWGPEFRFTRWSRGAERIYGWTAEEMIGARFDKLEPPIIHPDSLPIANAHIERLLSGAAKSDSIVVKNQRKDGSLVWINWHGSSLFDDAGRLVSILSQGIDITERVNAEQRERESSQRLRSVVDSMPVLLDAFDDRGNIIFWNKECERVTGYSSAEMVNNPAAMELLYPDEQYRAKMIANWTTRGDDYRDWEWTIRAKDGSERVISWTNISSRLAIPGWHTWGVGRDVTALAAANRALQDSEQQFRAAFELALVGMTQVDAVTRKYIHANEQFCKITGYSLDELRAMGPVQLTHPDDIPKLLDQAERMQRAETDHYIGQRRIIRKDGTERWLHVAASVMRTVEQMPTRVISAVMDITETVQTEQQLRESERRLATLVSNLPGVAYRCANDPNWTMEFISERTADIVGYPAEDFLQRRLSWNDLIATEDVDMVWQAVQRGVDEHRPFQMEYQVRHRDGEWLWMWEQGQGVYDDAGQLLRLEGFILDITQRKRAEEQLRKAKELAEAASRAKDRFIASLSHELRTPLTPARALLSVLRDDTRLPADVRADLAMVHRNVQTESALIDDLLDLTRLVRGDFQVQMSWCDAHVLIEQALKNAEASLDKKVIHFGRSLNARRSGVTADAHRLGQVLANLLGNAIKFTPSGGMITVSTEDDSSGGLRVSVSDTGIGIDASHLEHIFEPFERGELQHRYEYTGLGLGLAIARSLLTRMNGVISAASEGEGRGARFTFILPDAEFAPVLRRAAVPAQTGAPPAAEPMHGLNNRSVLLVEDHPATADILARLLRRHGCAVKTVATKAAAMEAVSAEKFDVILSDIGLPDGSGHELLHALRQRGVTTPAIALSGYGAAGDIAASADAGFAEHLTKPVDFDFLRSAIERTANRQRQS